MLMAHIIVENLGVEYYGTNTRKLFPSFRKDGSIKKSQNFTILQGMNFQIHEGDRVGLIGKNGAGKTTLLKVLSKILKPTKGTISISGEVASLLGPVPFINSDLSAVENVFNYCKLMEPDVKDIPALADDIKQFTELGEYFEMPLKSYSAGMLTKFQFALEP